MWDCGNCGCRNIAAGLGACPMCYEEAGMPRNTVGGGYSNQWEQEELPFEYEQPGEAAEEPEPDTARADDSAGAQEDPAKSPRKRKSAEEE